MLIYITGVPGTGKSSVCQALRQRGYESYDGDDGLAATYNKHSGQEIDIDDVVRTREWHDENEWLIPVAKAQRLSAQTEERLAFVCGFARNNVTLCSIFSKVIALDVDSHTLIERLAIRHGRFGEAAEEVELCLEWQRVSRSWYTQFGISVIDTAVPIDAVVEKILEIVG